MNTKELARQWFESIWNRKDPAVINQLMDTSVVGLSEGGEVRGPEAFRSQIFEPMLRAFPDLKVSIDRMISEGSQLALLWTAVATHKGPFLDIPASERKVQFSGTTWLDFKESRIVGGADNYNLHALILYLRDGVESATVHAPR